MTRNERKVALAQDVLAKLDADLIVAEKGAYLEGDLQVGKGVITPEDCQTIYGSCEMCAKGALLVSRIDKYNTVEWDDLVNVEDDYFSLADESTFHGLKEAFTQEELDLIEIAFEGWSPRPERSDEYDQDLVYRSKYMLSRDYPPQDRLREICNNIVSNNGNFIPPGGNDD